MKALTSLSEFYLGGGLTDELLLDPKLSPEMAMEYLTAVKGIGPWSANMFFMFTLHLPDFLPLGDLGVRGGIAAVFGKLGAASPSRKFFLTQSCTNALALHKHTHYTPRA